MGTRADFYVGRGEQAEWLGSIAWDGYPQGVSGYILAAKTEDIYRKAVAQFLSEREDATKPEQGWPWPWDDSRTTDYAYALDGGVVYAAEFGHRWYPAKEEAPDDESATKLCVFPNMKDRKAVTMGKRSGLIVVTGPATSDRSGG